MLGRGERIPGGGEWAGAPKEIPRVTFGLRASITPMSALADDLRYGIRLLRRTPGFAVAAILAVALGIGANTAIFSVVRAVLLDPLPYRDPGRVALVWEEASHI